MKNGQRFGILILIAGLFFLASCTRANETTPADAIIAEYSEYNGEKSSSGKTYLDVNLPKDHVFKLEQSEDILTLLKSGTGVVYFGFPTCPWCRAAIGVMDEAAKEVGLDSIYYVNVLDERDTQERNSAGEIVTTKKGTQFYSDLLEILGDNAPEYSGLEDSSVRRIHTPLVVVVVNGEIVATHLSTVESQEDPYVPMTQAQHDELFEIFKTMFSNIPGCGEDASVC